MTKEWLTADELAGIEGLPASKSGVIRRAKKDAWVSRHRAKGKGLEYQLDSLPIETQRALAKSDAETAAQSPIAIQAKATVALDNRARQGASKEAQSSGLKQLINLPEVPRQRAEARLLILQAGKAFVAPYIRSRQQVAGEKAFAKAYSTQDLTLPSWVFETVPTVSWMSLRRWQKTLDEDGAAALAGRYKSAVQSKIDEQPDMGNFLRAIITSKPHLAGKTCHLRELLEVHSAKNGMGWEIPSPSSIRRWVVQWSADNQAAIAYVTDPNRYNSKYRSAVEQAYPWMSQPNDIWEFDSTPVDAMLKEGRHSIIAVIDCFTRRVKMIVSPTSDSEGICLLLRKTLLDWGTLNEGGVAKTDNGSDYVSRRTTGVFNLLGINQERANPYSGWEKPFIERFFRTLSHSIVELLPGYIGHNVADREVIEAAKHFAQRLAEKRRPEAEKEGFNLRLTREELQAFLDNWLDAYYHHRPHQGEGMKGITPFKKYADSGYSPWAVSDEGALDVLLNRAGTARVLKGRIKCGGLEYSAPELMEHEWKGQKVEVFLDPNDVGRAFLYREGSWDLRVEAVDVRMIGQGVSPDAFRAKKREDAKALRSFRREMKELAKTFGVDGLHQDAIDHFTDKAKGLALFPQPSREHSNEAIAALSKTADRLRKPTDPQYSEAEIAHLKRQREAIEAKQAAVAQQQGLQVRNEHDKARLLAEQSLERELKPSELEYLADYKRHNRFGGKQIDEIMARKQHKSS
uniref:DNA-binding protein n=1 Tax=Marinobacterium profundum TaxID=1714300 RepID=UPI0008347072|nr:DNA-binding protein [Marinobacterium profundum]